MAVEMIEVEAWVLVDADGNTVVAGDQDALHERYTEDVGDDTYTPRRTFCVKIKVPRPAVVELSVEVPGEPDAGAVKVV